MKRTGLRYGVIDWDMILVVMPLLGPLLFQGAEMQRVGQAWVGLSVVVVALPTFRVGCFRERKG